MSSGSKSSAGRGTLTAEQVRAAHDVVRAHLAPTPLRRAHCVPHPSVWLKLECWQPTGSFKVRGALSCLAALSPEERARGIVAASAGNHALGVAHAVEALGAALEATLFVPRSAPRSKVAKLRSFPVTVVETGDTYDDAFAAAQAHAARTGATYVHAYDDPRTAAGQGTTALEIFEQRPDVGTLVVPVGGGGLMAAMAVAARAQAPGIRMVAVQPEASPSLRASLEAGRALHEYPAAPTLADGLAGGIGDLVFENRHLIDQIVDVPEPAIEDAIVALLAHDQVVAEASGAAGVAALRTGSIPFDGRPVAVVVTGGNIDAAVLARLLPGRV